MVTEAHEASSKLIEQLELEPITLPALNRQPRLLLLEKEVAERITVWRDWTPAGTRPYPSYSSKDKLDDFYGVLAGTKPAAYQVWRHHVPLPQIVAILKVAESLDYSVRAWEIEDQGDLICGLAIGRAEDVERLEEAYRYMWETQHTGPLINGLCREVGVILGYPDVAIEAHIRDDHNRLPQYRLGEIQGRE